MMTEKAGRIAELEREFHILDTTFDRDTCAADIRRREEIRVELVRLRNKRPKGGGVIRDTAVTIVDGVTGVGISAARDPADHERKYKFTEIWVGRAVDQLIPALTQGEGSEPVGWWANKDYDNEATWPPRGHPLYSLFHNARLNFPGNMDSRNKYEQIVDWLYAPPPPLPAGNADPRVREALERIIEACESQGFADNIRTGLGAYDACKKARNIARDTLAALPSLQSQGLVDAAEWLEEQARGEKSGTKLALSFFDAATALRGCARARARASDRSA